MRHELLFIAFIAALVSAAGLVPYVRDIFLHKTKPERGMWWIYSALFLLLFYAQMSAGAHFLLFVTAIYVLSSMLIAGLSIKYGYGRFHTRDAVSVVIAVIGLILWLMSNDPLFAILMVIIVDFAGFWLTLVKTWHAPHTETLIAWQLSLVGAVLSVFSIGSMKFSLVIYPIYAVLGDALLIWVIMYRRRFVKRDPADF